MKFFDLHIHSAFSGGQSSLEQLASTAKELGYTRIGMIKGTSCRWIRPDKNGKVRLTEEKARKIYDERALGWKMKQGLNGNWYAHL